MDRCEPATKGLDCHPGAPAQPAALTRALLDIDLVANPHMRQSVSLSPRFSVPHKDRPPHSPPKSLSWQLAIARSS